MMQIRWRLVVRWVAFLVAAALWTGATVGYAQKVISMRDEFGYRMLIVDGWRLIIPESYVDRNSNKPMLDWQYPDGTGRGFGFPLDDLERIRGFGLDPHSPHYKYVWMREGHVPDGESRPYAWNLPGYSLEWIEAMITWWAHGGDGCMEAEGGDWVEFDCPGTEPPDPVGGTPDPALACPPGMTPFAAAAAGCRITPAGSSSPATMTEEQQRAFEAYEAAKALCELNPTSDNCAARDRAYRRYTALMGGAP